jgi:hypothetical protein
LVFVLIGVALGVSAVVHSGGWDRVALPGAMTGIGLFLVIAVYRATQRRDND